jgi:hypothetical protein
VKLVVAARDEHEPVIVGITPNLKSPAVPVPVTPRLARRGSSPSGTCHLIVPLFKSYEVSVVYGGLTMFEYRP